MPKTSDALHPVLPRVPHKPDPTGVGAAANLLKPAGGKP